VFFLVASSRDWEIGAKGDSGEIIDQSINIAAAVATNDDGSFIAGSGDIVAVVDDSLARRVVVVASPDPHGIVRGGRRGVVTRNAVRATENRRRWGALPRGGDDGVRRCRLVLDPLRFDGFDDPVGHLLFPRHGRTEGDRRNVRR